VQGKRPLDEVVEKPTAQKPTLWRDMTPEEKGALLLGWHEGKVIEVFGLGYPDMWYYEDDPRFEDECAYRIKPEPKIDRVALLGGMDTSGNWSFCTDEVWSADTHKITFDTIDGKPDPASIKIEEV
jgi:hypothetical protein